MDTAAHTMNLANSFKTWSVAHSKANATLPDATPPDTHTDTGNSGLTEPRAGASGKAFA